MKDNKVLDVTPDVKWMGILDRDIVTFDIVMETKYGTTYNSYFINAEKKAVVETTKEKFWDTWLYKIQQVTDPAEIEYIILDHTEPDHSGNLANLLKLAPEATVVGSGNAIRYLQDIVPFPFKSMKVKDGDVLDLGNKTLRFISAPNLHWPDSIYTYLVEDKVLFTCDSFGAHFCTEEMFDDLVPDYLDSFKYYFDVILKPYSKFMLKAIEKIRPLDIAVIATGHGPILRSDWRKYVDLSEQYASEYLASSQQEGVNVLLAYVSAYGYTKQMAGFIAEGIRETGGDISIEMADIENMPLGEIDALLTSCNALLVGSPTINQNTLLPVYKLFALINPIRDKGKLAASFGSYGWSGEAAKIVEANLKGLKLDVIEGGFSSKFFPHAGKAEELKEFGREFGRQLVKRTA
ncbi:MAG: FprA family A-type flavoprotein [Marinilabiliales bacterium]|nr:MAG: FprA family A-type flavoprotein [Marinilabiliales bacterium]